MARPRDILQRFRFAGTPGAASVGGVPADRTAELTAELVPILTRLDGLQQETARVRADAERDADLLKQQATEQASAVVDAARREAEATRADAMARASRDCERDNAADFTAVQRQAAALRAAAARRMPAYVAQIVAEVKTAVAESGGAGR